MLLIAGNSASRLIYNGIFYNSSSGTSYTFNNVPIADAEPSRLVMMGIITKMSDPPLYQDPYPGISSVTVSNSTLVGYAVRNFDYGDYITDPTINTTDFYSVAIWAAVVPTGTTTDITVSMTGSTTFCEIAVWSAYNQRWPNSSGAYAYPSASAGLAGGTVKLFEGGGYIHIARPGVDLTGFDGKITGSKMVAGYKNPGAYNASFSFGAATATATKQINYGGLSFTP